MLWEMQSQPRQVSSIWGTSSLAPIPIQAYTGSIKTQNSSAISAGYLYTPHTTLLTVSDWLIISRPHGTPFVERILINTASQHLSMISLVCWSLLTLVQFADIGLLVGIEQRNVANLSPLRGKQRILVWSSGIAQVERGEKQR